MKVRKPGAIVTEVDTTFLHGDRFPQTFDSAQAILPIVFEYIGVPNRVIDLGGGNGQWLAAAHELGSKEVTCIDDPALRTDDLMIPHDAFLAHDLSRSLPDVLQADLAISLEVAEHLPEYRAEALVRYLCDCAPVILFSAAIPGQPGHGHINGQPAKYWRDLFAATGYTQHDVIRPKILSDQQIPYWYRQNVFLYTAESKALKFTDTAYQFSNLPDDFELVSERVLKLYRAPPHPVGLRGWLKSFASVLRNSFRALTNRLRRH